MTAVGRAVCAALASALGAACCWYGDLLLGWSARADASWDRGDKVLWRLHDRLVDAATLAMGFGELVRIHDEPLSARQRCMYLRLAVAAVGAEVPANIARAVRFRVLRWTAVRPSH